MKKVTYDIQSPILTKIVCYPENPEKPVEFYFDEEAVIEKAPFELPNFLQDLCVARLISKDLFQNLQRHYPKILNQPPVFPGMNSPDFFENLSSEGKLEAETKFRNLDKHLQQYTKEYQEKVTLLTLERATFHIFSGQYSLAKKLLDSVASNQYLSNEQTIKLKLGYRLLENAPPLFKASESIAPELRFSDSHYFGSIFPNKEFRKHPDAPNTFQDEEEQLQLALQLSMLNDDKLQKSELKPEKKIRATDEKPEKLRPQKSIPRPIDDGAVPQKVGRAPEKVGRASNFFPQVDPIIETPPKETSHSIEGNNIIVRPIDLDRSQLIIELFNGHAKKMVVSLNQEVIRNCESMTELCQLILLTHTSDLDIVAQVCELESSLEQRSALNNRSL